MVKKVDVIVIGGGTAGLSAFYELVQTVGNVLLVDDEFIGTTCAHHGCMPSKALIEIANRYHGARAFADSGIDGTLHLSIDIKKVMTRVRELRNYWVSGILKKLDDHKDKIVRGCATFVEPYVIKVGDDVFQAKKIIIAAGAKTTVPKQWQDFADKLLTSENIFEQDTFSSTIGVVGLGAIGLELSQALSRLGYQLEGFTRGETIAGLSDPIINQKAIDIINHDFPLHLNHTVELSLLDNKLNFGSGATFKAEQALIAVGTKSNILSLNLDVFDLELDKRGIPTALNGDTYQVDGHNIFIIGDANKQKPLLHEAAYQGKTVGHHVAKSINEKIPSLCPFKLIFTHPNIVVVGQAYKELNVDDIIVGEVTYEDQGRSRILGENYGTLHVYANKKTKQLLGAEMIAPYGEHLAHLLVFMIEKKITVKDALKFPYYHPTVEESFKTCFRSML